MPFFHEIFFDIMNYSIYPYDLDWGPFTLDGFHSSENTALHIFNFSFRGSEETDRIIRFSVGRINWASHNLPINCIQKVIFDIRGQKISDDLKKNIQLRIESQVNVESKYVTIQFYQ
jgi:hypothetical protein